MPGEVSSPITPFLHNHVHLYCVMTVMASAAIIAIAGNLLIIILFLKIKQGAKIGLTPHLFLTNLALCDLILGIKLPFFFLVTLGKQQPWILDDDTACSVVGASDYFAFRIVVAGMTAVAIDRYLAVLQAVRYPSLMSERRGLIIIGVMWGYCICWSTLPVVVGALKGDQLYVFSRAHNMCTIKTDSQTHTHKILLSFDVILNFLTPLSVMTFCYLKIARKVLSPKQMGHTIKKFMRSTSRSLRKGGANPDKPGYEPPKESSIGIKVDNCDSASSASESDYIELPAVTKRLEVDAENIPLKTKDYNEYSPDSSPVLDKPGTNIEEMYKKTGLSVSPSPHTRFKMNNTSNHGSTHSSRRGSWTDEAANLKAGARKMSTAVTNSVLQQLRKISHASNAYSKMSKYQQKIARTTVVVYFSFVICFTPFILSQVLILFNKDLLSERVLPLVFFSVCLVFISTCVNVIIYGTMHRNIKSTLKKIFMQK